MAAMILISIILMITPIIKSDCHEQSFLGCHLWFHIFFHPGYSGATPLFTTRPFYLDAPRPAPIIPAQF